MAMKRIPDKIRQKVIRDYNGGKPKTRIANAYGISTTSVTRIVREQGSRDEMQPAAGGKEGSSKEAPPPETQQNTSDAERRINDLEKKILYLESKKKGAGARG